MIAGCDGGRDYSRYNFILGDVRFAAHSGLRSDIAPCPLGAIADMEHYSITSSAIESNPDGRVSPSDLAVFKLITNSNLVGCMTGKSAGLAPLRIRPA